MEYKVLFHKKPPKGMTLVENENGYTININSVNWEIFPLWLFMAIPWLIMNIACFGYGNYPLLIIIALWSYLTFPLTKVVFIRAKLIVHKSDLKIFTFMNILLNIASYKIDLNAIKMIRIIGAGGGKGTAYSRVEFIGYKRDSNDIIAMYTQEYNLFISQFLNEYKNILEKRTTVSI